LDLVVDEIDAISRLAAGWGYERVLAEVSLHPNVATITSAVGEWLVDDERTAQDTVILYWTGHGTDDKIDGHRLFGRDSTPMRHTMFPPGALIEALPDSEVNELLFIIDACYAGRAGPSLADMAMTMATIGPAAGTGGGLVVMPAARAKQEAVETRFTEALTAAIERSPGGFRQPWLDLLALTEDINDCLGGSQHVEVSAYARRDPPRFIPNPDFGTTLALPDDLLTHWDPRSRGVAVGAERGRYFTGRTTVLGDIDSWLTAPGSEGSSVKVITGDPGSGKSAVLGQFIVPGGDEDQNDEALPAVDVAVVARSKSTLEIAVEIAQALLDVDAGFFGTDIAVLTSQLAERLTRYSAVTSVLVDGLDEANDPQHLIRNFLVPLVTSTRALTDRPGVLRLLVGARPPEADLFTPRFGPPLNLDDENYLDVEELADYVCALLTSTVLPDQCHYPDPDDNDLADVAAAIARRAHPTFLVARQTAMAIRQDPDPVDVTKPRWQQQFPATVGEVFDEWLARLGPDEQRVRDLLEPLAHAAGTGLPWGDVWAAVTSATSGRNYNDSDIRWLLAGSASSYLAESQVHGRSTYRLYHQALTDHLHDLRRTPEVNARIVAALHRQTPLRQDGVRDWNRADPYTRQHLADHAAAAHDGTLDRLVADPGYLAIAKPEHLLQHLHLVRDHDAQLAVQVYEGAAHHLSAQSYNSRASHLALVAMQRNQPQLAQSFLGIRAGESPWTPKWAIQRPSTPHRILGTSGNQPVKSVALGEGLDRGPVVVAGSQDGLVRIWDLATDKPAGHRLEGHTGPVSSLSVGVGADGRPIVASGSIDNTVRVWDLATGEPACRPLVHPEWVYAVAAGEVDGQSVVVSGGQDGLVRVWDLSTGAMTRSPLEGDTGIVRSVAIGAGSEGRPTVVSGSIWGGVRVWDLATGEQIGGPPSTSSPWEFWPAGSLPVEVTAVAVGGAPDGRSVVVWGGNDSNVRMSDLASGEPIGGLLRGHTAEVTSVAVGTGQSGRSVVVSGSRDKTVRVWDLATGDSIGAPLDGHLDRVNDVGVGTVNGQPLVASGSEDRTVRVWALAPFDQIDTPPRGNIGPVPSVAVGTFLGQGVVVSASHDRTLRLRDLSTGNQVGDPLSGHTDEVNAVAIGAVDGREVAVSGSRDMTVRVWDLATGNPIGKPLQGHSGSVWSVAVGALGDRPVVVSGSEDQTCRVWDLATGDPVGKPLQGHSGSVWSVAIGAGPGGMPVIASGGADATVRVWDPASGALVGDPLTHTGGVIEVAVGTAQDGLPIAVCGSRDKTVRVWDLTTGWPVGEPLEGHTEWVNAVACAVGPDGEPLVVTGSGDRTVALWSKGRQSLRVDVDVVVLSLACVRDGPRIDVVAGTARGLLRVEMASQTLER